MSGPWVICECGARLAGEPNSQRVDAVRIGPCGKPGCRPYTRRTACNTARSPNRSSLQAVARALMFAPRLVEVTR